jgi:hypothetical protein
VADRDPKGSGGDRVFVSSGDTLNRKRITGSGSNGTDFTWSFEDGSVTRRLVARKQGDEVTGIALASPDQRSFLDQLGASAEPLVPVDPRALTSLKVRNLPGEITLEYVAAVQDGSQMVVTRPLDDWTYEDFRVFYGRDDRLVERTVHDVSRGSYTSIDFIVDGSDYHATFSSILAPAVSTELNTGAGILSLTTTDPPTLPTGVMLKCLH